MIAINISSLLFLKVLLDECILFYALIVSKRLRRLLCALPKSTFNFFAKTTSVL